MNKIYKYIMFFVLMFIVSISGVKASNSVNLCEYNTKDGDVIQLRYHTQDSIYNGLNIYVNNKHIQKNIASDLNGQLSFPAIMDLNSETGDCPNNVYIQNNVPGMIYCFDEDGSYCKNYNGSKLELSQDVKNVYKNDITNKLGAYIPYDDINLSCLKDSNCIPLCYYSETTMSASSMIYYYAGQTREDRYWTNIRNWTTFLEKKYRLGPKERYYANSYIGATDFIKLENGVCPKNFYFDTGAFNETCYDNQGFCISEGKFEVGEYKPDSLKWQVSGTLKEKYLESLKNDGKDELDCDTAKNKIVAQAGLKNVNEICGYTRVDPDEGQVRQFFIVNDNNVYKFYKYVFDTSSTNNSGGQISEVPIDKVGTKYNPISFENSYTCITYANIFTRDESYSTWESGESWEKIDEHRYAYTCSLNYGSELEIEKLPEINDCESLIGAELVEEINSYMLYIKIAVPIIIIVMGSLDFGKAFISSDEDGMKKAQKRFIQRLIIGMVIFFLPTIVRVLLNIANQVWGIANGTCGITF